MDWNEDVGDTSIDEIFNFNGNTKEEKKKKRSSILKQSKYANIDFCDNEETVTDHNRRSLRMKRVSFAETFQVKEMHTGNIYDIPGFNESNASRTGPPSEPEKDCTGGNLKSRSSIPETSVLQTEKPMNLNPLMNEEEFRFEPQYASYSILDKSSFGTELQDEIPSQSSIRKGFLEDDNMEMTMEHGKEEMTHLKENNFAVKTVISTSIRSWKTVTEKNACPLNVDDLFDDSPFKSGSQEYEHKGSLSPLSIAYAGMETAPKKKCLASSNGLEFNKSAVPLFEEMSGQPQFNLNASNKENILQISPKFQNLKFIDSPPKWANVSENILNSLNMMDFAIPRSISNVKPLQNTNEGKENIKSQRKGLRLLTDENQKDVPLKVVTPTFKNPKVLRSAEGKSSERNKTPVSMDLTLMPEGCSEDSSVPEKDVGFEPPRAVNKYADLISQVMEKTNNKTRFSICDMEMTCLADNPLEDSSLCLSPHKSQEKENIPTKFTDNIVLEKIRKNRFSTCNMDLTCLAGSPIDDSSLDFVPQVLDKENLKAGKFTDSSFRGLQKTCNMDLTCLADSPMEEGSLDMFPLKNIDGSKVLEKTNNKTRFSTCNMDLTCLADKQTDDCSLDMSVKIPEFEDTSTKVLEKTNNKTRFSTCNMDLTCLTGNPMNESSMPSPENRDCNEKMIDNSDVIEDRDLNQVKYNTDICDSSTGQKYLKISTLPHKNNRILVNNAFDKENFSESFELKNKENIYSNRKRSLHSNDKPVKLPLGEKLGALCVRNFDKPFSSDNCLSKSGVATIEQNVPCKSVGFLEETSFPEASADSKMSNLYPSNSIDMTHHDMCLDDSMGVKTINDASQIVKVQILTESKISSDNMLISRSKYEKTSYSMSNDMSLTCHPDNKSGSFLESGINTGQATSDKGKITDHLKNLSNSSSPMNNSAFKRVGRLPSKSLISAERWSICENNKPDDEHFSDQAMELTCQSSLYPTKNDLTRADGGLSKQQNTSHYQLQEIPVLGSPVLYNVNQNKGLGGKMFELCTDNYSFSSSKNLGGSTVNNGKSLEISKDHQTDGINKTSLNNESRADVNTDAINKTCLNNESRADVNAKSIQNIEFKKPYSMTQEDKNVSEMSAVRRQPHTPGVVFNIRKIRQSLKESASSNIVLYPELSQVMKKHKFGLKHPYSELKITSPVITEGKRSRSFSANMSEASFICPSREGSRQPSIESSFPQKTQEDNHLTQDEIHLPTRESLAAISCNEHTSAMDDSLQLLPHSVLENSFLDAASRNLTIGLDRSDFVVREPAKNITSSDKVEMPVQSSVHMEGSNSLLQDVSLVHVDEVSTTVDIPQVAHGSILQSHDSCASQHNPEANKITAIVDASGINIPSPSEYNKPPTVVIENWDVNKNDVPSVQNSVPETDICLSSFADRLRENEVAFPMLSVRKDVIESVPKNKLQEKEESFRFDIPQKILSPDKAGVVCPVAHQTLNFSNAAVSFDVPEDISEELVNDAEADISIPTLNKPEEVEGANPPDDSSVKKNTLPQDAQQAITEELHITNKEALKNKDSKHEDFEAISVADSSVVSETSSQPNLISLREKFEKASLCSNSIKVQHVTIALKPGDARDPNNQFPLFEIEGMLWRVKSMSDEAAVFELRWKAYVFECTLRVEVESISASECSVLFKPIGPKLGNTVRESVIDDIRDRGHDYFNYLVTDTVFPFPIYSDNLINKMAEYSAIAKRIKGLMLDLLKCSITGTNEVSYKLDPLTLYVQICNEYFECVYDVTFPIDLKTYPNEKIVPDVKHMYCKDITEQVRAALREVEPGKDYLYRMIDVAREVKN